MNWDRIEGNWKRFKDEVKAQWGRSTDNHRDLIAGKRAGLAGKIQQTSAKELFTMREEIPPRRIVLRGALAVGCGLLAPIALSGCDSKKGSNSTSAAPASSPATSTASAAPAATGKVAQASVQYQTQPKGEQKCGGCQHFIAGSKTCMLVAGQISPEGWCSLWAKKA